MKTRFLVLMSGMSLLAAFTGCQHATQPFTEFTRAPARSGALTSLASSNQINPAWLQPPTNLFTLGPGDRLDIELMDETNTLTSTIVGPDGKVYFNLLPGLDVWGLDLAQARALMERGMAEYVRGQPRVALTLRGVESKRVWLLGRFQQPGVYTMTNPATLLEAISMAGGSMTFSGAREIAAGPVSEDLADLQRSFIIREGRLLPVDFNRLLNQGDLSQNIYLQPDDFVYFAPSYAKQVYVLGAVLQPKPVQYVHGMTLIQAISGAYGTVRDAWLGHVTIIRGSLSNPQVAFVNYYDIVKGQSPDVQLQPHDIVYVPLTRYRYLRKYLDIALNTFVSSVAINAGSRLSTPSGGKGGSTITIPVGSGITIIPPPAPPIH